VNGRYRDFDVAFEHAAPKRTAADLLGDSDDADEGQAWDDVPFE